MGAYYFKPTAQHHGTSPPRTRGLALAIPSWALAAVGVHLFAKPGKNAPDAPAVRSLFLREGLAFLILAVGPLAFLVAASMALWNR